MICDHTACPTGDCSVFDESLKEWAIHEASIAPGRLEQQRKDDLFHEILRTIRADCPSQVLPYFVDALMREAERRGLLDYVRVRMLESHSTRTRTKYYIKRWRGTPASD